MILVDTSIWVDHLRRSDAVLAAALNANVVAIHPFVIGELACGLLKSRAATDEEVLDFLDRHRLMGRGLGYIDAHLLAATALHGDARLWTRDRRLKRVAVEMALAHLESAR
jgi:hypothetical protein